MRITHQQLTRNFNKRMNSNLSNLTKSNEKMASGRAYKKGYENVVDAGKALKVRKLIDNNQQYLTTIRDIEGRSAAAEDGLRTVSSLLTRVTDRVTMGLNGTLTPSDREKLATEIAAAQTEVLQIMNSTFAGKHVYNAAGGSAGNVAPFDISSGALTFNGSDVNTMHVVGGKTYMADGVTEVPYNNDNYVDIGFGFKQLPGGGVDPNTAFKDTYSGLTSFGCGVNADGIPLNAYSLLGDLVDSLNGNDVERLGKGLDAISDSMSVLLTSIADIGSRSVLLEDTAANLEEEYENLLKAQGRLEFIDISEEAIYNKDFEMSWMVTLQLGSKILPQTIFDFIR